MEETGNGLFYLKQGDLAEPEDNIDGVDEDARFVEHENEYEDIESDSNDYFENEDW